MTRLYDFRLKIELEVELLRASEGFGVKLSREFPVKIENRANSSVASRRLAFAANAKHQTRKKLGLEFGRRFIAELRPSGLRLFAPHVLMVRVGPRFFDTDNLAHAFKAVRDGVAEGLGVSDAPDGPVTWWYHQAKRSKYDGFEIHITDNGAKI